MNSLIHTRRILVLLALAAATVACDDPEPDPIETPAWTFVEDGATLDLAQRELVSTTTQRVEFCGTDGRSADGRKLCLAIDFDPARLAELGDQAILELAGVTTLEGGATTWAPANGTTDVVRAVVASQQCACTPRDRVEQAFSGTLRLARPLADAVSLQLELEMSGNYAYDDADETHALRVDGVATLGVCPLGPTAPLGDPCTRAGLVCRYGYESLECGGRTVECVDGRFIELEHTDPDGDDCSSTAPPCPEGPQAPLGAACSSEGQRCDYGYEPIECGGRRVECSSGTWIEVEHTDPQPSCTAP